MPKENKCEELKIIKGKLDNLIVIKNKGGLSLWYSMYLDSRILKRSSQILRYGNQ